MKNWFAGVGQKMYGKHPLCWFELKNMCTCVCVCLFVWCMSVYTCTHASFVSMHACVFVCVHACVCVYVCACVFMCMCVRALLCKGAWLCVCVRERERERECGELWTVLMCWKGTFYSSMKAKVFLDNDRCHAVNKGYNTADTQITCAVIWRAVNRKYSTHKIHWKFGVWMFFYLFEFFLMICIIYSLCVCV